MKPTRHAEFEPCESWPSKTSPFVICDIYIYNIDVMGKFIYMTQPSWTTLAAFQPPRWRRGGSDAKAVANGAH